MAEKYIENGNTAILKKVNDIEIGEVKVVLNGNNALVISDYGDIAFKFPVKITLEKFFKITEDEFYLLRKVNMSNFPVYEVNKSKILEVCSVFSIPFEDEIVSAACGAKTLDEFVCVARFLDKKFQQKFEFEVDFIINNLKKKTPKFKAIMEKLKSMNELRKQQMKEFEAVLS